MPALPLSLFFFFNDTATTEIYTLSLHDALPICSFGEKRIGDFGCGYQAAFVRSIIAEVEHAVLVDFALRSEEHTSELQSLAYLVCRLLLEKKKKQYLIYCVACPGRELY